MSKAFKQMLNISKEENRKTIEYKQGALEELQKELKIKQKEYSNKQQLYSGMKLSGREILNYLYDEIKRIKKRIRELEGEKQNEC